MSVLILGVDAGNSFAKVVGEYGEDTFDTTICDWFERKVKRKFSESDMEWEIDGRKGFAGAIAKAEDEYECAMYGNSKAHDDTKIRVLLAIFRYLNLYCPDKRSLSIVVGQPFKSHNDTEKKWLKDTLEGSHSVRVNNQSRTIHIENVEVAVEGGAISVVLPKRDILRIIDIGSATVNAISINNGNVINRNSDTFNFGMETVSNKNNLSGIANGIIRNTTGLRWDRDDKVYLCGGVAIEIAPYLSKYYESLEIIRPELIYSGEKDMLNPSFANAVGFYEIAMRIYK